MYTLPLFLHSPPHTTPLHISHLTKNHHFPVPHSLYPFSSPTLISPSQESLCFPLPTLLTLPITHSSNLNPLAHPILTHNATIFSLAPLLFPPLGHSYATPTIHFSVLTPLSLSHSTPLHISHLTINHHFLTPYSLVNGLLPLLSNLHEYL